MAAGRTVEPDRRVHSMHAYFLQLGDPKVPIVYDVDRIRDGGSFTTRRVVAIQHGQAIFNLAASFQVDEARPRALRPDARRPGAGLAGGPRRGWPRRGREPIDRQGAPHVVDAFDFRPVDDPWRSPMARTGRAGARPRPGHLDAGATAVCPTIRSCTRASSRTRSDLTLLGTATLPHPLGRRRRRLHDGEPRPRDVVPPPVPRRRVAAVPRAQPVGRGCARASRPGRSSAPTARWRSAWRRKGCSRADASGAMTAGPTASSTSAPTPSPRRRRRCGARWPTPRSATTRTARTRPCAGSSRWRPALLGKEAALYVPSGTMANQLALRVLAPSRHRGALRRAGARVPLRARRGRRQRRRAAPSAARRRRHAGARRRRHARRGVAAAPPARPSPRCSSRTRTCRRAGGRGASPSSTR